MDFRLFKFIEYPEFIEYTSKLIKYQFKLKMNNFNKLDVIYRIFA